MKSIKPHEVDNAVEMFTAVFKTMTSAHDSRYISKKHVNNIAFIPMKGISAMDFNLNEKRRRVNSKGSGLYNEFLKGWTY